MTAFARLKLVRGGMIRYAQCRHFASEVATRFKVKSHGVFAGAASLSGGNLQKFIVGREICQQPSLLIVAQPTWGVDAGAAQTIHLALRELADAGTAIIVISQDLDELMSLSDNLAAICAGELSKPTATAEITVERIGLLMAGAENETKNKTETETETK